MFKLWPEQQRIVDRFKDQDCGALLLQMGAGKTAITINILKTHINNLDNQSKRILVVCPSIVIKNWEKEFKRFYPDNPIRVHASTKDGKKRINDLNKFIDNNEYGIVIVNYEVAVSGMSEVVERWNADTLIFDESHRLKNPKSKQAKFFFSKLRKKSRKCFILTGTFIANSIEDAYQQFLIMDLGQTYGTNFFVFRRKYMIDLNAGFAGSQHYFPKWVPNPRLLEEFKHLLMTKAEVMKTKDMVKLPELEHQTYYVKLSGEQEKHYRNLKKLMVTEIKDELLVVDHALTKMLRLTQVASGHLPDSEGSSIYFNDIEKIKVLQNLVKDILIQNEKVIIWTCFKADIVLLTKALKEIGIHDLLFLTGSQSNEEKSQNESLFRDNPQFKVMMCNIQAASTGTNLQIAKHAIYYNRNFSFIHNNQSMLRNYRGGSIDLHDKILIHNIVTQKTVEEDVVDALEKKRQLGEYILDNLEGQSQLDKDFKKDILARFLDDED